MAVMGRCGAAAFATGHSRIDGDSSMINWLGLGFGPLPLPLPPSRTVWTGDKGYRCSGTWVTPFRVGSKRLPDLMLLRRLWGCGHRSCDVHKSTGRCVDLPQINPADALNSVMHVENLIVTTRPQRYGRLWNALPMRIGR